MEGGLDVGHIFTRLDAKFNDSSFKRYDQAVDKSRAKTREMARDQDRLGKSTQSLSRDQQRHAQFLRSQGHSWESVAQQIGVNEDALKSWNTTSKTTTREQEKVRKSTRDSSREFAGMDGSISRVNRTTAFFSKTLRLIKWPAFIAGIGAALQGANALTGGVVALTSALAPLSGLLVAVPAALGTLAQGLGTAALSLMGVKNAVKALSAEEAKGAGVAEDTAKKHRTAATQIRGAKEELTSAERTEKDSVNELTAARKSAVETLQDQRNAAIDARLAETGSQLALRRAIAELWKAQEDPHSSFLDIEELEQGVKEARQGVKEARLDSKRARHEDRKAQRGGVKKDPEVLAATRSLNEAQHEVAKSARGVKEAERESKEALTETSSAASAVEEKFSKLTPQAAKFARFLFGLKPQLEGVQKTAAKGFLPGAESGIRSALQNLPIVNKVIGGTGRVLGNLAERAGRLFGSKGFGHDLEIVGRGNAKTLGLMGRGTEHLLKGLTNVMVVAQPFIRFLGKYTNGLAAAVEHSTEVNKKNGDMAKFFGRTKQVVQVLTSIFGNLGGTLHVIGEEAAPLGRQILGAFDEGSEGLEKWAKSIGGRNSIAQYFEDARGPLFEAGRLVSDIVKSFFELGDGEGMESIQHLLHQLRVELLPIFTEVTKETTASFGPHLVELLTNVLGLFGRLSGGSGPLTLYVDTLSAAAKITNTLLDTVPGFRGIATNLLGLAAVMKTVQTLGRFTGITKGLELVFGPELGDRLKGRFRAMMKAVFLRGALAANFVASWGADVASQATNAIGRQIGKFRAVGRRMAIAFISLFAPEVAAGMAAGGKLGEVLAVQFPRLSAMFKKGGRLAGRAFIVGVILGVALLGIELGKFVSSKLSDDTKIAMKNWGINAGQNFVNGLIWAVNKGTGVINDVLDKANLLSIVGVDAPNIGKVGDVDFSGAQVKDSKAQKRDRGRRQKKRFREEGFAPGEEPGTGIHPAEAGKDGMPLRPDDRRRSRRSALGFTGGDSPWSLDTGRRRQGGKKPEDEARDTGKKVTGEHRKMRRDVEDETNRLQRGVIDKFSKMRKGAADESQRLDKAVTGSVTDMQGQHDRATRGMLSATDTRFQSMADLVSERSSKMAENLVANVDEMNATTTAGMAQIQTATVNALKAFGVKDVNLDLKSGSKGGGKKGAPQKKAEGGVFTVPGQGLQDTVYLPGVHAMVAPGEDLFAANRHQQPLLDYAVEEALGVSGGLDGFFSTFNTPHYAARGGRTPSRHSLGAKIKRYAGGGMVDVPSDPDHATDPNDSVAAAIEPAVNSWVKRYQANITAAFDPGGGHLSPGHNFTGTATDVVPAAGWTGPATKLFEQGLKYLISKGFEVGYGTDGIGLAWPDHGRGNHAHIEWVGNGTTPDAIAALGGMAGLQRIKKPVVDGTPGTERTLVQAALDRVTAGANKFVEKKTGAMRGGLGEPGLNVPTGPIQRMARQMVSRLWGPSEFGAFNALEMSEAGWDPRAENPESGAAGLAQALPPSKYPPGAWPYSGPQSAKLQLQWMMSYIKERYGSPAAAWSFHQANNWYAKGGRMATSGSPLRRFAKGGSFKGNINHKWAPHWSPDFGGPTLPSYVTASLAEAAGMPGRTMEQVTRGESGSHTKDSARPGSAALDPNGVTKGYGMWAITSPYSNPIVSKYGGYNEMFNPVKNAAAADEVLAANGLGAWYGTGSVTGSNLHYKGSYDIRNALGGMSFKEALHGRKAPGKESIQSEKKRATKAAGGKGGKGKRKPKRRAGLSTGYAAEAPKGKYSPAALMKVVSETGISLPYGLSMYGNASGAPNWRGLSAQTYGKLVDQFYRKVAEYREKLGEERQAAEESFPSNNLLSSVTALSANTIQEALGYHPPLRGEANAYAAGYEILGSLDERGQALRGNYLNTYTEGYLKPYRRKESIAEYNKENALAVIDPEREQSEFARAALRGLRRRSKQSKVVEKKSKASPKGKNAPKRKSKTKTSTKKPGRRYARGGRIGGAIAKHFSKGGKAKGQAGLTTAVKPGSTPAKERARQAKKVRASIQHHSRVVNRRAKKKTRAAEEGYEDEMEGIEDPLEKQREEEEWLAEYEEARRNEIAPLLSELAFNVQRTANVGRAQSSLFAMPSFARGGRVPAGGASAPPPSAPQSGNPNVTVPLGVHLSGGLEALNPHIQAEVDGKLHDLGQAAGVSRATVSSPGRRVSYRGK